MLLDEQNPSVAAATLAARLREEHGVDRLDVVIANAGGASVVKGVLETEAGWEEMGWDFEVNALGTARLFRGIWGLLDREREDGKAVGRFVVVSSSVGSIGGLEEERYVGGAASSCSCAAPDA